MLHTKTIKVQQLYSCSPEESIHIILRASMYWRLLFRAGNASTDVPVYLCFYGAHCESVPRTWQHLHLVRSPCRTVPYLSWRQTFEAWAHYPEHIPTPWEAATWLQRGRDGRMLHGHWPTQEAGVGPLPCRTLGDRRPEGARVSP